MKIWTGLAVLIELAVISVWSVLVFRRPLTAPDDSPLLLSSSSSSSYSSSPYSSTPECSQDSEPLSQDRGNTASRDLVLRQRLLQGPSPGTAGSNSLSAFLENVFSFSDIFDESITPMQMRGVRNNVGSVLRQRSREVSRSRERSRDRQRSADKGRGYSEEGATDRHNISTRRPFSSDSPVSVTVDSSGNVRPLRSTSEEVVIFR